MTLNLFSPGSVAIATVYRTIPRQKIIFPNKSKHMKKTLTCTLPEIFSTKLFKTIFSVLAVLSGLNDTTFLPYFKELTVRYLVGRTGSAVEKGATDTKQAGITD